MRRILLNADVHPLSEFRSNSSRIIAQVHKTRRPVVITQHGKSSAVLLDVDEFERMVEKLELLDDIETASRQVEEGGGIADQQVRERVRSRIRR